MNIKNIYKFMADVRELLVEHNGKYSTILDELDRLIDEFKSYTGRLPEYIVMNSDSSSKLDWQVVSIGCNRKIHLSGSNNVYAGIRILIDDELDKPKCV